MGRTIAAQNSVKHREGDRVGTVKKSIAAIASRKCQNRALGRNLLTITEAQQTRYLGSWQDVLSTRLLHSATLFPPLLQQRDVHNEEQGFEETRNQYKRETLHQTSVVKRAEQDCIQEIGDAEQVP